METIGQPSCGTVTQASGRRRRHSVPSRLALLAAIAGLAALVAAEPAIELAAPAQAQEPAQAWVGDLPIMEGMRVDPELGIVFDAPSGRIVLVFAHSQASRGEVLAFYEGALPSLGWRGSAGTWRRDGERLAIERVETSLGQLWRLRLTPQ